MKRLNNKGITTVEVLICFVLVVIITISMYQAVSAYNERRIIEGYKQQIITYKNILTKAIQDDFIKIGLTHAKTDRKTDGDKVIYTVDCELKDGTKRQLVVEQTLAKSSYHIGGSDTVNDSFMIKYGTPPTDLIEYPLPELGSSKNDHNKIVKDLSINNVLISIKEDKVLSIYIGFYHPELTTRYGISVICPIDYITTGSEGVTSWTY